MGPLKLKEVGGQIFSEDVSDAFFFFPPDEKDLHKMDTFITLSHSLRMFSASPIFRYQATEGRVIRVSISYFDLYLIFCWEKSLPLILGILIWAYATVNQIIGTELSPWLGQSINNIVLRAGRNLTHHQYHQWQSLHFKREKTEVKWLVLCLLSKFVDALVWSERAVAGGKRKEGQRDEGLLGAPQGREMTDAGATSSVQGTRMYGGQQLKIFTKALLPVWEVVFWDCAAYHLQLKSNNGFHWQWF